MANKLYEENDIAAIATAIRAKNGSSNTYTVSQMAPAINNIPSGGGSNVVNGIIESYKAATSTIDANTFVEFINLIGADSDTQLSNGSQSDYDASAVLIDTNKVFIAHATSGYLYGVVCTISGTTITVGTDTQLSTGSQSYGYASAVLVDANKVFIAHRNNSYLYGLVCTISGTTITVGTDTQLSADSNSYYDASAVLLDTNKVFIAHRNSNYLYGLVCTISGTTITVGTDTQLSTGSNSYEYASAVLIDTNKVFIAHGCYSTTLYGTVCTISGTTIVAGLDTQLSTDFYSHQYASAVLVDTDKVFIAHRNSRSFDASERLYGMVLSVLDGTRAIESTSKIDGLTKTSCTTTTAGQVWVLNN